MGNTKSKAQECRLGGRSRKRSGRIGYRRARGICAECFHVGTGMQPSSTPASWTIGRGRWHRLQSAAQWRLGGFVRQQMAKRADGGRTPDPAFGDEPAVPSSEVVLIEQAAQHFSREKTLTFDCQSNPVEIVSFPFLPKNSARARMPYLLSALGPQDAGRTGQEAHADRPPPAHRPEFPAGS